MFNTDNKHCSPKLTSKSYKGLDIRENSKDWNKINQENFIKIGDRLDSLENKQAFPVVILLQIIDSFVFRKNKQAFPVVIFLKMMDFFNFGGK